MDAWAPELACCRAPVASSQVEKRGSSSWGRSGFLPSSTSFHSLPATCHPILFDGEESVIITATNHMFWGRSGFLPPSTSFHSLPATYRMHLLVQQEEVLVITVTWVNVLGQVWDSTVLDQLPFTSRNLSCICCFNAPHGCCPSCKIQARASSRRADTLPMGYETAGSTCMGCG